MHDLAHEIMAFISAHPDLAVVVIGLTAFGESFAFIGFLFPGTTILIAAGTLVKTGTINPVYAAFAASTGAVIGDGISFWIGQRFGHLLPRTWPFHNHPHGLERGMAFFKRYGWASVFIGRFFGPLRAVVPLAAGMMEMPTRSFYAANILSAIVWAPALLMSGYLLSEAVLSGWSVQHKLLILVLAGTAVVVFVYQARRLFRVH
jgi:membrane protein DedA with SNARE-associated domain